MSSLGSDMFEGGGWKCPDSAWKKCDRTRIQGHSSYQLRDADEKQSDCSFKGTKLVIRRRAGFSVEGRRSKFKTYSTPCAQYWFDTGRPLGFVETSGILCASCSAASFLAA